MITYTYLHLGGGTGPQPLPHRSSFPPRPFCEYSPDSLVHVPSTKCLLECLLEAQRRSIDGGSILGLLRGVARNPGSRPGRAPPSHLDPARQQGTERGRTRGAGGEVHEALRGVPRPAAWPGAERRPHLLMSALVQLLRELHALGRRLPSLHVHSPHLLPQLLRPRGPPRYPRRPRRQLPRRRAGGAVLVAAGPRQRDPPIDASGGGQDHVPDGHSAGERGRRAAAPHSQDAADVAVERHLPRREWRRGRGGGGGDGGVHGVNGAAGAGSGPTEGGDGEDAGVGDPDVTAGGGAAGGGEAAPTLGPRVRPPARPEEWPRQMIC
ncbi:unnamed protein product [Musa banksii]